MSEKIITIITVVFSGGLLAGILKYSENIRRQKVPEFDAVTREYREMLADIKSRVEDLEVANRRLLEHTSKLDDHIIKLEQHIERLESENDRLRELLDKYEQGEK